MQRRITPQKAEIAILVARGYSGATIGKKLDLSAKTVKNYISDMLAVLGLENRVQLAIWALKQDLVSLDEIELPVESEDGQ